MVANIFKLRFTVLTLQVRLKLFTHLKESFEEERWFWLLVRWAVRQLSPANLNSLVAVSYCATCDAAFYKGEMLLSMAQTKRL